MQHEMIERMLLRIRKELDYTHSGTMLSKVKGEGFDFAELVPYLPGMNAKNIYWNSLAKRESLQSKAFYEEREIDICLALMLDGSLRFGKPVEKFEKLLECAAWLGYMTIESGNRCSALTFEKHEAIVMPPTKNRASLEHFIYRSGAIDPLFSSVDLSYAIQRLQRHLRKRSLLFIVGDFLEIPDLSLLAKRHALFAVVVRDRFEARPEALGECVVTDPVTGEEMELLLDAKTAQAYGQKYRAHNAKMEAYFRHHQISFRYLYTDEKVSARLF